MPVIDLVFRTVGERTSQLALELAKRAIRPDSVRVIDDVRPLSRAIREMLRVPHEADFVVYVDADCLIFEDMRPFLDSNDRPYVDCFVTDRFRGRIHCGVHVTRADVVAAMAAVEEPKDDPAFVLRPESRRRKAALKKLDVGKDFRNFDILHDFFQSHRHVFAKYALRELRCRTPEKRRWLEAAMADWPDEPDFAVARMAVRHARQNVPEGARADVLAAYIESLESTADAVLAGAGLEEKEELTADEVEGYRRAHPEVVFERPGRGAKVFGIGLSRTGTRSLNLALQVLGYDAVHYPADAATFDELSNADFSLSILERYDAITDITVAPYYAQLDKAHPGSKFVLTVRDVEDWLASARNHWAGRPAFPETRTPEEETYMQVRRLLRAAVYGCYGFDEERFRYVYDLHIKNVREYFAGRPEDLLVLDICGGHGWGPLCGLLGLPEPRQPFPHKGRGLSLRMRNLAKAG